MDNSSYRIQIFEEAITNDQSHLIDDKCFINAKSSYEICLKLLWIEEKLNIVSGNYYAWEKEIMYSYDFLQKNSQNNSLLIDFSSKEIIEHNRLLLNILSSIRLYRDQVMHDLSSFDDKLKCRFEKETNIQYDKSFSYQIMEFLRNYMQHEGLVIERISAIIPFFPPTTKAEHLLYFVEADYKSIKKNERLQQ